MVAIGKPVRASEIGWDETVVSRLYGYRLALMRGAWVVVAFLALVVFMTGLPASVQEALRISEATRLDLAQAGLSPRFPAYFI